MIQSIDIENFRCFEKTEIKGFQRMNLITGKNNSGKTALLEALYLSLSKDLNSVSSLSRNSSSDSDGFDNLFFQRTSKDIINKIEIDSLYKHYLLTNSKKQQFGKKDDNDPNIYIYDENFWGEIRFIFDKNLQIPNLNIINIFDNFSKKGNEEIIEKALALIDEQIIGMRTYSSSPNVLFIKTKKNKDLIPIFYFGDAIQKVFRYVVNILDLAERNFQNKILLIDEIENGLHYTAQEEFWRMLFKLCIEFDVQLFATTHSLEMIKAYQRVAAEFENQAAYFEMARHAKTNQIIGIKHEMDVLEYELVANETIRGE